MPTIDKYDCMNFLGLSKVSDRCDETDDRDEVTRRKDNLRMIDEVYAFVGYLSQGKCTSARQFARDRDWSREMEQDALNWWYRTSN